MSLTETEHLAMKLTAELTNLVCQKIIGYGPQRENDINEFVSLIHLVQARIMAQSAAHAHPELYRRLGHSLALEE